jgi:predicted transcriptional regulator of viral defense system
LGPQAAKLVTALHERNRALFTLGDAANITGLRQASARSFIRKLVGRGVATRLKPGLFVLVPFELGRERQYLGNPFLVAKALAGGKDYYLSHGTAMEIHQMATQPRLVVSVTTPKPIRPRTIGGTEFRFIRCRRGDLFGIVPHWVTKQETVQVSDLERTVIDGLRHPEYCGGITEVAKGLWIQRDKIRIPRLVEYALHLGVGAVIRRLGFLLECYEVGTPDAVEALRRRLTSTYVALDPVLPREGRYLRRWRLCLNVSPDELRAVGRA